MQPIIVRSLYITMVCCLLGQQVFGQNTNSPKSKKTTNSGGSLSGIVIEADKSSPLPAATIYIPDLKIGVVSDSNGHFSLGPIPPGNYLVQVHYVGFKTVTRNININGNATMNFALAEYSLEESPVVVTGLSKATQIRRSPIPIVAINHEYMNTNLSTNIIDAIAKVPGVNALTTGPNVSKPFIRGLGYNRILTLYDGVRQEGQQWGDEHGIEVDQYGVDRIEIIKGPASLTYGSDAIAGVVNLIPTPPAAEGKLIGQILTEYQTNNGLFGGSAFLGVTHNGLELMTRVSDKLASNYRNKIDGRVYNTAFREKDANISLGLHRKWGFSRLNLSLFDDIQEIPDGSRDSASRRFTRQITEADSFRPIVSDAELRSYAITPLHQHVQHYRIYSTNNFILGSARLAVNLGYQQSVRREFSHPEIPFQDIAGLYLQLKTYSYDLKYFFREFGGWSITTGLNGMYQDNMVNKGTEFVIPSYHQFDVGPFTMIRRTFDKLDISAGIRFDLRSFNNSQLYTKPNPVSGFDMAVDGMDTVGANHPFDRYQHNFSGFSGSMGFTYNFSDQFSVKANLARGFRAPNIAEISSNGVHPGTNIYQIGNPDFKPEFNLQEDIGFEYSSKYAMATLSLFNNNLSNYIFNQRLSASNGGDSVVVAGNQTYKFQQGKAQLFGGELGLDIHLLPTLHFENTISIVYGINKGIAAAFKSDSTRYVPFIPPLHGISEIRYDFKSPRHHLVNGFLKLQLAYYASQERVYSFDNTETPTPGYALFNAGIGAGLTNRKSKVIFNLHIMGNNLFNTSYQDHLSRLKYFEFYSSSPNGRLGIYNMGRNIQIKLDFPFESLLKKKSGK